MSGVMVLQRVVKLIRGELSWVVGAQLASLVGGFALVKILALNLGAAGFGYYSLCLSVSAMISLLWYGPLDQIVLRYWAPGGLIDKKVEILAFVGHLVGGGVILLGLILAFIISLCYPGLEIYEIIYFAFFMAIPRGVLGTTISVSNALRNRRRLFYLQFCDVSFRVLALYILKNIVTPKLAVGITAASAALVVGCFFLSWAKENNWSPRNKFAECNFSEIRKQFFGTGKYLNYGLTFVLIGMFASTCNYADRWIIQYSLSLVDVGIYSGIAQIATAPLILVSTISTQFLSPLMFAEEGFVRFRWSRIYALLGSIYISLAVFAYIFSEQIILFFLSSEFLAYQNVLPVIVFGLSFFYLAQLVFLKAQKNERPSIIGVPWAVRSVVVLGLGIGLAPLYGVWGVVAAVVAGSIIFFISLVVVEKRYA